MTLWERGEDWRFWRRKGPAWSPWTKWINYEGDRNKHGEPHGQGVAEFKGGVRHEGLWKDGMMTQGVSHWANGERYEGQWDIRGKRHGQGTYYYSSESPYVRFEGQWKSGLMSSGTEYYVDGSRFEGEWRWGTRDRKGVLIKSDGTRIELDERTQRPNPFSRDGEKVSSGVSSSRGTGRGIDYSSLPPSDYTADDINSVDGGPPSEAADDADDDG